MVDTIKAVAEVVSDRVEEAIEELREEAPPPAEPQPPTDQALAPPEADTSAEEE